MDDFRRKRQSAGSSEENSGVLRSGENPPFSAVRYLCFILAEIISQRADHVVVDFSAEAFQFLPYLFGYQDSLAYGRYLFSFGSGLNWKVFLLGRLDSEFVGVGGPLIFGHDDSALRAFLGLLR